MFQAVVMEQVGADIKTTSFVSYDIKGYFPKILMNIAFADQAKKYIVKRYQNFLEIDQNTVNK